MSVNGSDFTITPQASGSTTVTVRATDRAGLHVEQSFSVTVEAQVPRVTIARQNALVTEGHDVEFTLTASSAPAADLMVKVSVTETGSFLAVTAPTDVTIAGGSRTAQLTLQTADDTVDEANGTIAATVQPGTGYTVGSSASAATTVKDNDRPPTPTRLRANGNLDSDGNVTLRWKPVSRATGYNVRYIEEVCDSDGVCEPDPDGSWQTRTNIATSGILVKEATFGGLTQKKLYRIEVQVVIVDYSNWSDFTLVFPTDSPIGHGTDVATAPFHGYQAKNSQGSHEFRYVLCEETIPTGLTMTAQDMKDAVDEWEDTVTWNRGGANIIATTAYALPSGKQCSSRTIPPAEGRFEVKFASGFFMGRACNPLAVLPGINAPPACWRSTSWDTRGVQLIGSGSVILNADRGAARWNESVAGGRCARLHETIVHEVGHAFGIGNASGLDFNRHPINTMHSIMSYANLGDYCEPQIYDIVALIALYQSR